MDTHAFTDKQEQYLAFIHYYTKVNGVPPAESDMPRYFGVTPSSVHRLIVALEDTGLITRTPRKARTIAVALPVEEIPPLR